MYNCMFYFTDVSSNCNYYYSVRKAKGVGNAIYFQSNYHLKKYSVKSHYHTRLIDWYLCLKVPLYFDKKNQVYYLKFLNENVLCKLMGGILSKQQDIWRVCLTVHVRR